MALTEEQKAKIEGALASGNTRRAAYIIAGVPKTTFYDYIRENPEYSSTLDKAESEAEKHAMSCVTAAMIKDWHAAKWWLETRRYDDYGKDRALIARLENLARDNAEIKELLKKARDASAS